MSRHSARSSAGNRILRFFGFFLTAVAAALFIWLMMESWGYAGALEYVFGAILLACVAAGASLAWTVARRSRPSAGESRGPSAASVVH